MTLQQDLWWREIPDDQCLPKYKAVHFNRHTYLQQQMAHFRLVRRLSSVRPQTAPVNSFWQPDRRGQVTALSQKESQTPEQEKPVGDLRK